jgi:integrase
VHLKPALGESPVGTVTPSTLRKLVGAWAEQMSARSVRRVYGTLRAIFAYAVASEVLVASPCRGIKLPEVEPVVRPVISSDELARLSDELGEAYAVLPYLGAVLGLRWGECAGLRVKALDLLGGTLSVVEQATRGPKGATVFGPPKSAAGRRTLAVPRALGKMLSAHLARRGLSAEYGDELVFAMPDGGVLDYRNFRYRIWTPATKRAGVPGLSFHDLRRANASGLVHAKVDLKTAQTRLGHSDPRLTLGVYAQAISESDRAAADALESRFFDRSRDQRGIASA